MAVRQRGKHMNDAEAYLKLYGSLVFEVPHYASRTLAVNGRLPDWLVNLGWNVLVMEGRAHVTKRRRT
jgi:hypothetical protein